MAERIKIYSELSESFENSVPNVACRISDNVNTDIAGDKSVNIFVNLTIEKEDSELPKKGNIYFWTGITKRRNSDGKAQFVNEYSGEQISWDPNLWPGPVVGEGCTMVRGQFLVRIHKFFIKLKKAKVKDK